MAEVPPEAICPRRDPRRSSRIARSMLDEELWLPVALVGWAVFIGGGVLTSDWHTPEMKRHRCVLRRA